MITLVGQDGILRADGIGPLRVELLSIKRPIDNRPQDVILPHLKRLKPDELKVFDLFYRP